MYARVTPYKMKSDHVKAATDLMGQLRSEIMGLPGMQQFVNVMQPDGSGYIIALVDSEAVSNANSEKVMAIWAKFGEHLEKPPVPAGYAVIADWS